MSTSLKSRMTLVVSLLVAGLVSVTALAAFSYFERQFKEIISGQQNTLVSAMAGNIDEKILTAQGELTAVAGTITPELLGDAGGMRRFLNNRPDTFGIFDSGVYIFSPGGRLLASIHHEQEIFNKDSPYLAIVQKTVAAKSPRISEPIFFDHAGHSLEHPFVVFTAPVFTHDGRIAGVLAGSLNLLKDNFLAKLADVKIGKRGYLYLYTTDRKLIIHPDRARVITQDIPQPGINRLFDRSMEGFEGTGETVTSKGLISLSTFKRLKTTNWILAANFPRSEVYAPINQAKRYLVGALAFVVLCSVLVVRFFMQYLTAPLLAFTSRVGEMTSRESAPTPIQVSGSASAEIATLARVFNGMLAQMERRERDERDQLHFLRILLDTMPNPVFYKDAEGKYLGCNRTFETCIGLTREELVGKSVHEIAPPELAKVYAKADAELFRHQGTQVYEAAVRYADGTNHDVIFYKAAFQNTNGALGGLIGTFLDITDRKHAEAALVEQTEFTNNLIRNSAVPTFVLDNHHRVLIWNRACEELTGVKSAEVIGTDQPWKGFFDHKRPVLADFIIDGNHEEVGNSYDIHSQSPLIPDGLQAERWFTDLNGRKRYVIFNAAPIRNGRGELIAVIETLEEITERKLAAEMLSDSEMKMRAILDTAVDGIITINEQGLIESVNRSCERMFGYDPGTLAGRNVKVLMPSPFREEHDDYLAHYLRTGEKRVIDSRREVVARRENGTLFPVELAVSEVRLGERRLFTGIISNITERKLREDEMLRTLSLHVSTLESTADGIMVVDLNGKIVSFNRKFAEMWRIPESVLENLDNERALSLVIEQLSNPQEHLAKIRDLYSNPDMESSDIIRFKDGRIFERYSKPQRIRDAIVGRVWSLRDITEQRKLEGQLRQSQKMEALGTLAGGVAHDFNNILTAIIGFGSLLQRKMDDTDPNRHYVEQIIAATERAAGLTQSLLAYSRKEPLNPGHVDLNEIVRRVGTFLTRIIGEDVELELSLADETLIIMADSGQIEQILMNLATNARDAMAGAGSLVISTSVTKLGEEFVTSHGYGQPGLYALLAVSDDGSGMEPETRERIFEPFFTTKERGRGTGLGLSIVYGIVKQHHGFINVYSEPGRGTTLKVYFPLAAFVEEESKIMEKEPIMGGTETILLIEDSREIRELLGEVLSGAGYTVIEAVDGQDGVEKFREHQDEVQLLILDVIMPRKNGKEAYDEICKIKSDIRAIFTSGYTADIINRKGVMEGKYNFLAKPLSPDKLLLKIREVLAG